MNIFVLDIDHDRRAQYHHDRHMKLILEAAQMMITTIRVVRGNPGIINGKPYQYCLDELNEETEFKTYKATHINHPCTAWVRQSATHWGSPVYASARSLGAELG